MTDQLDQPTQEPIVPQRVIRSGWYRDVWLLIITLLALVGIFLNHNTIVQQRAGRHFAVGVTCAALSAIAQAGQQVIAGTAKPTSQTDDLLRRLGYPPYAQRAAAARKAAQEYVQHISLSVQSQVGGRASHLVRPDGTIDCNELQRLSNTVVGN